MKHTEQEIKNLKNYHIEMWNLVESQVTKAFDALKNYDTQKAREIIARERVVNAQELVVDHHLENFIALFAPVAIDLRFVLSLLKINNNLERIGDFAESIALFVLYKQNAPIDHKLYEKLRLDEMMDTAKKMLSTARIALIEEDSKLAASVFALDSNVDEINKDAVQVLADYIVENNAKSVEMLGLHAVIRRIERVGDRVSNIAEDIVFFVDAKELRHQTKNK